MASKGAAFDLAVGWWNLSTIYLFRSLLGWIALTCDDLFSLFSLLTSNGSSSKTQLSVSCCICWTDVVSSLTRISEGSKKYHFLPLMIKTHAFTQMSLKCHSWTLDFPNPRYSGQVYYFNPDFIVTLTLGTTQVKCKGIWKMGLHLFNNCI